MVMFYEDYHPPVSVVSIGDKSLPVLDYMMNSDSVDEIVFIHLNDNDLQIHDAIQKSHLLYMTFDSSIGVEINLAIELATQARAAGILTVGICCIEDPILSGSDPRWQFLDQIRANVDTLAIVASTKFPSLGFPGDDKEALGSIASECQSIVHSLSYIFTHKSFVGIDFTDVREALSGSGYAAIGTGHSQGDDRGVTACAIAIQDLTSKGIDLHDVRGVSVKISGHQASLNEFSDVMEHLESSVAEYCRIVAAAYWEDPVDDESLSVSLLVSGLTRDSIATLAGQSATVEKHLSRSGHAVGQL